MFCTKAGSAIVTYYQSINEILNTFALQIKDLEFNVMIMLFTAKEVEEVKTLEWLKWGDVI